MKKRPKKMLFELPVADEIDGLATSSPRFEVRAFEYDRREQRANLNYSPCKGQIVLVICGEKGTVLARDAVTGKWTLPSGRVGAAEEVTAAAKRVAKSECGVGVRGLDLVGMYDVVWHFSDISIKRLHLVYAALTDDQCFEIGPSMGREAKFFLNIPQSVLEDDLVAAALGDCSNK
ncbi:MAG: NUDIX hydrolase [Candidatus Thermoplasmatota archaeon]|nr:NUDIX hydrolase [Candidatus Thermoplasmatota archaeon]